jgi:hypothetical protein
MKKAKAIWEISPQATVYTNPEVLNIFSSEVHWWLATKGEEEQCLWPVTLNQDSQVFIPPFSYCQSPLWTPIGINIPHHRSISKVVAIYETFIERFIEEYGQVKASLHPSLIDVRAFDWWNYGKPLPQFKIKPRYTAVIKDIVLPEEELISNFRTNRRRELKKFHKIKEHFYFDDQCSAQEFITLYRHKLNIEKNVSDDDLSVLLKIVNHGFGWILAARRRSDNTLCGLIIVFNHKCTANLVINIALDEYKKQGLMAECIARTLVEAKKRKITYFDFNGANSPNRGDDKHSYNAEPVLYFDIEYPYYKNAS